jgi:hypothetical protein
MDKMSGETNPLSSDKICFRIIYVSFRGEMVELHDEMVRALFPISDGREKLSVLFNLQNLFSSTKPSSES